MTTPAPARLYIAVRGDLSPGLQSAQAVHAAFQFAHDYPALVGEWLINSNYLVLVSVPNEDELLQLAAEANLGRRLKTTVVWEPDLGEEATALAIQPGDEARKLCANLPLALREAYVM